MHTLVKKESGFKLNDFLDGENKSRGYRGPKIEGRQNLREQNPLFIDSILCIPSLLKKSDLLDHHHSGGGDLALSLFQVHQIDAVGKQIPSFVGQFNQLFLVRGGNSGAIEPLTADIVDGIAQLTR